MIVQIYGSTTPDDAVMLSNLGVENIGVANRRKKFRDNETSRRLDDVLSERPPAEIIHLLHFAVGTFKERDVFLKPVPRVSVGDEIGDVLIFH